ncbi:myeloid-associated differentiation marker-like [Aulostomus maculatus]
MQGAARDFASPLFLVRTCEVFTSCTTFSLMASLEYSESSKNTFYFPYPNTFRIFCMFTWCVFFALTLLIHILSLIQFHSLIPISWKNLTLTVAVLGALMGLSASVFFSLIVMDHHMTWPHPVATAVASCVTCLAYISESCILCTQPQEQRGYMGSMPGLLKLLQLWGGCQMIPLVVEADWSLPSGVHYWQLHVSTMSYGACLLMSLVTLVVILGDFAGRCLLPFDKFLSGFSMIGMLLYMMATVICFTKLLQLINLGENIPHKGSELFIMEIVVASITLLAYTVDHAFSVKLLCDRICS